MDPPKTVVSAAQATPPASFPLPTRGSRVESVLSLEICEDAPESGGIAILPAEIIHFSFSLHNLWPVALHMSPWHLLACDLLLEKEEAKGNLWVQLDSSKPARVNMK